MNEVLTPAQMAALKPYEDILRTMHYSGWSRNVTTPAFRALKALYDEKTGRNNRVNANCNACVSDMLRKLAGWYYATKEAESKALEIELREKAARRDAQAAKIRIEAAEQVKREAEKRLEEANERLAQAEQMKAEAARELEIARASRAAAERVEAESVEAQELAGGEKPGNDTSEAAESTQTPKAGTDTGKAEKAPKPARLPRNVKPKTN